MRRLAVLLIAACAACSAGGGSSSSTTTTSTPSTQVSVRFVVAPTGFGCTNNTARIGGRGHTLVAKNGAGAVLATGKMDLTPGHETCDFTASFSLPSRPDFLVLENESGAKLVTIPAANYTSGSVTLNVDASGDIS